MDPSDLTVSAPTHNDLSIGYPKKDDLLDKCGPAVMVYLFSL